MQWLNAIDLGLLHFINETLSNPFLDRLMPFASGNRFFFPVLIAGGLVWLWQGGARARLCALMLALLIWPGDTFVSNTVKKTVQRPRPFVTHPEVRLPASKRVQALQAQSEQTEQELMEARARKPAYNSMPSSHAFNWFAAAMILFVFYRRSLWVSLPLATLVAVSRVYNGVHYPSDVLAGAFLGAGYAVAGLWLLDTVWKRVGREWFPIWWKAQPSLLHVKSKPADDALPDDAPEDEPRPQSGSVDAHWMRLGYALIAVLLFANLAHIAGGSIELSGDEAYQWVWSKHLALSYYSKPPMIAYAQFLGTSLWGDNELGVRFFSPVIGAAIGFLVLRFFAREVNARAGFFLVLMLAATPLTALGSVLMTVDPLSVLFWTAAMMAGWRAIKPESGASSWFWVGLWMGLGFLSKYTALLQWLCWAVLFLLWKPARVHLRRPGPYLALLINALCAIPVLVWNYQHHWITVSHVVHDNAGIGNAWKPKLLDFLVSEFALLNPVFFIAAIWAAAAFWKRRRQDPRLVFCFSMGAPLFLGYALYSLHSRILPNWIAPSVVPLFCLMTIYWDTRWRLGLRALKPALITGLAIGAVAVAFMHETDLVKSLAGRPLPPKPDPLTRVRAHSEGAKIVNKARARLLEEGKPVFIIGSHYQITGLMSFYIPEARTNVAANPLVYCITSEFPQNQFYFWPGYENRKGENAIFVREIGAPSLVEGWFSKWLAGETNLVTEVSRSYVPPAELTEQFESITDLGLFHALYRGRVFHTYQLLECRNLQ